MVLDQDLCLFFNNLPSSKNTAVEPRSHPGNMKAQKSPGQKGRPVKVTAKHAAVLKSS